MSYRLLSVPFWIVERARNSQAKKWQDWLQSRHYFAWPFHALSTIQKGTAGRVGAGMALSGESGCLPPMWPGSIARVDTICGLSLPLVLTPVLNIRAFLQVHQLIPLSIKTTTSISNFQFLIEPEMHCGLWMIS